MLPRLAVAFLSFLAAPAVAWFANDEVTLAVPGIQCNMCLERLTESLSKVDPSVAVTSTGADSKEVIVAYDESKVTLHRLMQAVAETQPVHNKPYEAGVRVTIEDPAKNAAKVRKALTQVKGVGNFFPAPGATPDSGDIVITLRPLPRNARPNDQVKASQIAESLEKNGVEFSGLPMGDAPGAVGFGDPDTKKRVPTAKPAKGRLPEETEKPARTLPTPRSRPVREPSDSSTDKDTEPVERPRFEILAEAGGKVYLVDHETKSDDGKELKKFVKQGDKFGDYTVQKIGQDDDGLFVDLTLGKDETIRVQRASKDDKKDKEKSPEKSTVKNESDKETRPAEQPRFQILAFAGDKVYLADNENRVKKFLKVGDVFGDFTVKELNDKDGGLVILETKDGKEIRIEEKKDDKKEKAKDDKEQVKKETDSEKEEG